MIAGLEGIDFGEITIGDRVVNTLPPKDRDIAMAFSRRALSAYDCRPEHGVLAQA